MAPSTLTTSPVSPSCWPCTTLTCSPHCGGQRGGDSASAVGRQAGGQAVRNPTPAAAAAGAAAAAACSQPGGAVSKGPRGGGGRCTHVKVLDQLSWLEANRVLEVWQRLVLHHHHDAPVLGHRVYYALDVLQVACAGQGQGRRAGWGWVRRARPRHHDAPPAPHAAPSSPHTLCTHPALPARGPPWQTWWQSPRARRRSEGSEPAPPGRRCQPPPPPEPRRQTFAARQAAAASPPAAGSSVPPPLTGSPRCKARRRAARECLLPCVHRVHRCRSARRETQQPPLLAQPLHASSLHPT